MPSVVLRRLRWPGALELSTELSELRSANADQRPPHGGRAAQDSQGCWASISSSSPRMRPACWRSCAMRWPPCLSQKVRCRFPSCVVIKLPQLAQMLLAMHQRHPGRRRAAGFLTAHLGDGRAGRMPTPPVRRGVAGNGAMAGLLAEPCARCRSRRCVISFSHRNYLDALDRAAGSALARQAAEQGGHLRGLAAIPAAGTTWCIGSAYSISGPLKQGNHRRYVRSRAPCMLLTTGSHASRHFSWLQL